MEDWIKIGNEVYVAPCSERDKGYNATITSIGRKLFYLNNRNNIRVDIETLWEHNIKYSPSFKVYSDKENYEREVEVIRKRRRCERLLHFLTFDEIEEIYDKIESRKIK